MKIPSPILRQAMELYLQAAYPAGTPQDVTARTAALWSLPADAMVPLDLLERQGPGDAGCGYVVRLGQPMYPHMKIAADEAPGGHTCHGYDFLLRVDTHDRHLHAAAGSPDAAWLEKIRMSNKELGEKIEGAWAAAGLPTFKEFLRKQLEERKRARGGE